MCVCNVSYLDNCCSRCCEVGGSAMNRQKRRSHNCVTRSYACLSA